MALLNVCTIREGKVLIAYILFHIANREQQSEKVIYYGEYLLEDERINNYAIEILLSIKSYYQIVNQHHRHY